MKYGIGLAVALLATACSNEMENDIIPKPTQPKEGNIEIILPTSSLDGIKTRANGGDWGEEHGDYNVGGSCTVDKGIVLVFSAEIQDESNPDEWKQSPLTYETSIPVEFKKDEHTGETDSKNNYDWKAKGKFTPSTGKWYRLYAFAYNSKSDYFSENLLKELSLAGKRLQNQHRDYTTDELASITLQNYLKKGKEPIEIFGGFLGEYKGGNYTEKGTVDRNPDLAYAFKDDEAIADAYFGGNLRRKTGRLDIKLTGMAENNVVSASMIIEKYIATTPIGMEKIVASYYNPFNSQKDIVVATVQTNEADGNICLSADMLPFTSSYVNIRLEYQDGTTRIYRARCKDSGEIAAGPDAIVTHIAKNSQISLPENFWITLEGSYEQLTAGGNLSLQECWDENYEGGTLTENKKE